MMKENRAEQVEQLGSKYLEFEKMFPPFLRDFDTGLCIPEIAEGWEWCFDPTQCYVLEKLDGTNVKLEVNGEELDIFARNQKSKGYVKVSLNDPQYKYIVQGVANAIAKRKSRFKDGIYFGEVVGKNIQGNPYKFDTNLWLTFEPNSNGAERYKDFPNTSNFEDWKEWILGLKSKLNPDVEAEGIIFLNKVDGRMAKLRKDMFCQSYQPVRRRNKGRK